MSAPLVVNTKEGVCWTRRTVTSGGIALYAPETVRTCPAFVMATLSELAEHGIVGSADVLPMPVGPEPQVPGAFRFILDIDGATDREDASWAAEQAVSAVEGQGYKATAVGDTEGVADHAHYRAAFEAQRSRAETLDRLLRTAQDRVAELEAERHSTNESLDDAVRALREMRDRTSESYPGELAMLRGLVATLRAVTKHGDLADVVLLLDEHQRDEQDAYALTGQADAAGYPPALPWAHTMPDDEGLSGPCDCGEGAVHYTAADCPQTGGVR